MKAKEKQINIPLYPKRLFYYPTDFILVVFAISFGLLLFTFTIYLILKLMSLDIFEKKPEKDYDNLDSLEDLEEIDTMEEEDLESEEKKTE